MPPIRRIANLHGYSDLTSLKFLGIGFFLYLVLFLLLYSLLHFWGFYILVPDKNNILSWDAVWYDSIRTKGYEYNPNMTSNSGFFPLFPYVWRVLHLNSLGISVFNFLLFFISMGLLYRFFRFQISKLLIYISLPTGIFFFLPYSEALFFFFTAIFLIGLKENNQKLVLWGLLLASLTRATAMFFIPSIIIMEILRSNSFLDRRGLKNILLYSGASLLGLLLVILFQYWQTHEWFAFAKQQVQFWKHSFNIPGFPLISHRGEITLWLDGFAFFAGICSTFVLVIACFTKIVLKVKKDFFQNRAFWFSAGYILMVTVYSLFFNPKYLNAQTSIDSMNRYIFATSFFCVFFISALSYFPFNVKYYSIFAVLCLFAFLLLGFPERLAFFEGLGAMLYTQLFFGALFIYINLHYLISHLVYGKIAAVFLFLVNVFLSTHCLHRFISLGWIA